MNIYNDYEGLPCEQAPAKNRKYGANDDNEQTNIVTKALRIAYWRVLFRLLHYVFEQTSRFIET